MKKILLLDDDKELCEVLREFFLDFGVNESKVIYSYDDITKLPLPLDYDLAILDVNLGENKPSGIDAYHWLMKNNFKGKIVFLSGHANTHPLIREALKLPNTTFMSKPASIESLSALVT